MKDSLENISQSSYLRDCMKYHYLNKFRPDIKYMESDNGYILSCLKTTRQIAAELFGGGIDIRDESARTAMTPAQVTIQLIKKHKQGIYYRPEFFSRKEKLIAHGDILIIAENKTKVIRVKSATKIKEPQYIDEVGFLYKILQEYKELKKVRIELCILNKEYELNHELDIDDLFRICEVTNNARLNQPEINKRLHEMRNALSGVEPVKYMNVKIGAQCKTPYKCGYYQYCSKALTPTAIENIKSFTDSQLELLQARGVENIGDIPYEFKLNDKQRAEIESNLKGGKVHINSKGLGEFLEQFDINGPLTFLDFETELSPVPKYFGTHPYQQIPFQYCCLYRSSKSSDYKRYEFLAKPGPDPRRQFIERLIEDLNKTSGPIFVYFETFEKTILQQLGQIFPEYHSEIFEIINRIVDICKPFKEKHFYHPLFQGRYSLKVVYSVLYPTRDYKLLEIKDGLMASHTYSQYEFMAPNGKAKALINLRQYCYTDVLAMVRLLQVIYESYTKKYRRISA